MNIFLPLIFNISSFFLRNNSSCILKKADPWHLPTIILPQKTWQHIKIDRIFYPKAVTTCLERRNCFSLFLPDTVSANNYGKSQIFASKIIIFSRCKTYNRRTRFFFNPHQTGVSESLIRRGGQMPPPLDIDQIMDFTNYVFTGA